MPKHDMKRTATLAAAWEHRFQQLVYYKQVHGHSNVPEAYPQLGPWALTQRAMKRTATLAGEREAQLESIGFNWGKEERVPRAAAWEHRFQQLLNYKQVYGGCKVPGGYKDNPQLAYWANAQRVMKRKATLGNFF
jgi:hypothetical protein